MTAVAREFALDASSVRQVVGQDHEIEAELLVDRHLLPNALPPHLVG